MKTLVRLALLSVVLLPCAVPAATFIVVNTNSTGAGSLAQAIADANASAGADTISFAITNLSNTIRPSAALPTIVEPVTINGRTQTGFVSAPIVEISGGSAGVAVDGLKINTSNCVISALVINNFLGDQIEITNGFNNTVVGCYLGLNRAGTADSSTGLNGVLITNAAGNVIGGFGVTNRNYISGNNQSGIAIGGALSASNSILGNVIGLNVTNNPVANSADGIRVNAPFTLIGGNSSAARNIISGNTGQGIEITLAGTNTLVRGNFIGTDVTGGLDRGNTLDGILSFASGVIVGGANAGDGNVISGNNDDGIEFSGTSATNNLVLGNTIGTTVDGLIALQNNNNGVLITTGSRSNIVGGVFAGEANVIAFNGGDGISVAESVANTNNTFRGNSIFSNVNVGIDLGATGFQNNDPGDSDVGANQLQNFPILSGVTNTPAGIIFAGTLNSRASAPFVIDFYSSVAPDPFGNGEGQTYLGATNLTTDGAGNVSFLVLLPGTPLTARYITATVTDDFGNTSEFSPVVFAASIVSGQIFTVVNTNDAGVGSLRQAIQDANVAVTVGDRIEFAITNLATTITPGSALPTIIDPVTIDGYSQPGAVSNTSPTAFNAILPVRLAGAAAGAGVNGLLITAGASTVRGLMITGFNGDGIELSGYGGNLIEGCLIGLDAAGADQGNNGNGILIIESATNVIGGVALASRNVISGNNSDGIEISGTLAEGNRVINNLIGSDASGLIGVGNDANGVLISSASANRIGGVTVSERNLISANFYGIGIIGIGVSTGSGTNLIQNNWIGTDHTGIAALGNLYAGIYMQNFSHANVTSNNIIAFTGGEGIAILTGVGNAVRRNSIFSNARLGFDLGTTSGVTTNDLNDADTGANQLQNFPVLTAVTNTTTGVVISGSLASVANRAYQLDFFVNRYPDSSGHGEGELFLGSTNVLTDGSGQVNFVASFPTILTRRFVTATATDTNGNTSEFSRCVQADSMIPPTNLVVTTTADAGAGSLRAAIEFANDYISSGRDVITFAIPGAGVHSLYVTNKLPSILDPTILDGYTQAGASTNTLCTGNNAVIQLRLVGTNASPDVDGLTLAGPGNSIVRGFSIVGFASGVQIVAGTNHQIAGCFLGIEPDGNTMNGNRYDGVSIWVNATSQNRIGGLAVGDHNVISGNLFRGISIYDSSSNVVSGNLIGTDATGQLNRGNHWDGVIVSGSGVVGNVIGGTNGCDRNVISGNGYADAGMRIVNAAGVRVIGNYIGLDATGTQPLGNNRYGVQLAGASFNMVGGATAGERNLICANEFYGVLLESGSHSNSITGNFIGTDVTGSLDPGSQTYGMVITGSGYNLISGNVISGNNNDGVYVVGGSAPGNRFLGNRIGMAAYTNTPLGNYGVGIRIAQSSTQIGGTSANDGNVIAHNLFQGITVSSGAVNSPIRGNAIFGNGSLGIDLNANGVTANDAGDADNGGNTLLNYPVITSALRTPTNTTLTGTLNSRANTTYRVELFDNASADDSGFGEGQVYLGFVNVTTTGSGNASFNFTYGTPLTSGHYISATTTDPTNSTSEFSAVCKVVPFDSVNLGVSIADSDDPASRGTNHFYTLFITNSGPVTATSVFVTNTLPPELVFVNATLTQGSASHASGVVTLNFGAITNGGVVTAVLEVNATATGMFVNQALVVAATQFDHTTNNNVASEATQFGIADLAISITDSPDPVVAGQPLTLTVVATNRGPDAALLVSGSFNLDASVVPISASVSQGSYSQNVMSFNFNAGSISAGGSATLTVTGIPTASGLIHHNAGLYSAEVDFVQSDNSTHATTIVTNGTGVLQFICAAFNASESSAMASVTVQRTGGAAGSVAADYVTSNGSATAGMDYSHTVGTLSFTNGETIKTFSVPVINDAAFECNEFFNVALHSPTGGLVIIGMTQAVVTIIENDLNLGGNVRAASGSTNLLPASFANDSSFQTSVSADGRFVTFSSHARNLAAVDNNSSLDVFVRDLLTQTTSLVSAAQTGDTTGNGYSQDAIISGNGRYVLFASHASDLVISDGNGTQDVFVRDLLTGVTTLASINAAGTTSGNGSSYASDPTRTLISSNGQWIAYAGYATDLVTLPDSNDSIDVFLFDLATSSNRLVSVNLSATATGNSSSFDPVVSANGQVVAFKSYAADLVADDSNSASDVFVRDMTLGVTELVSVNLSGTDSANGTSASPYLNADGRYVAFASTASNLATNDINTRQDVFWRDRVAGFTRLVSVNTNGDAAGNSYSYVRGISANGRYVLFSSFSSDLVPGDNNSGEGVEDVFVRDIWSNTTALVSVNLAGSGTGNSSSHNPVISGDGSHVAFESYATNLTAAAKSPAYLDVFVRNLTSGVTRLVSFRDGNTNGANGHSFAPAISFDGNVTAFAESGSGGYGNMAEGIESMLVSGSPGFSDVWAHTYASNTTELVTVAAPSQTGSGYSYDPQVSQDGLWVAFTSSADNLVTNDANNDGDVFVMNVAVASVELISVTTNNGSGNYHSANPSISSNGNVVAFESHANNLVTGDTNVLMDVFVRDRLAGASFLVSINVAGTGPGNDSSYDPAMTPDGRYIAFVSYSTNLSSLSDSNSSVDVFLRDRVSGTTTHVSRNLAGNSSAAGGSYSPVIGMNPASGKVYVAYLSSASNLVNNDTNNTQDVFLYDVTAGSNYLASISPAGNSGRDGSSDNPQLAVNSTSGDVFVAYSSYASDLVANDTNTSEDVFIYRLSTGVNELVSVNQSGNSSGNENSSSPTLSADGRYVAFASWATNLTTGDSNIHQDVFLRDLQTDVTTLISKNCEGGSANGSSFNPVISLDGRYVSYLSGATDLVPGNFSAVAENLFRYNRQLGATTLISQNRNLTGGANANSYANRISENGDTVAFESGATDLVMADGNNEQDVFVWRAGAVTPLPDLVLHKTASANTVSQASGLSYTLAVTNAGLFTATSVIVTDNLPAGVSFVSATSSQGTVTNSGSTVTAVIGGLSVNAGASITINVTALSAGSISNYASSTAFEADPTPANNSASAIVTVTPLVSPPLSIQQTNSTQLLVSWPASTPAGFVLQTTTNLTPVIVWSSVTNSVTISGTNKFVILDVNAAEPERYYRLKL